MATRVAALGELLGVDELERKIIDLSEQVELKKEEVKSNFQQLHGLLAVMENFLLKEMDEVVTRARQEVTEKKTNLQQLYTAREGLERDLTQNTFKKLLEKNLRAIEDEIGEEVARGVNVGWLELEWKREELEQSVIDVCRVVSLKEKPVTTIDYSVKKLPVWSRVGTGSSQIIYPMQIAIDDITQRIFVADYEASRIQVFNREGNHLYELSTPPWPVGIALTDDHIFVSTKENLLKIEKSNNKSIKSVETKNRVWGITTNNNSDIYGCENHNKLIIVFNKDLKFLTRIKLKTTQVTSYTQTHSIQLYNDNMYVMFGQSPPFHLQIFTLQGELVRCLIKESEIGWSYFFSIDQLGNIIVADWSSNTIKMFSNKGEVLHTITSVMPPVNQRFHYPYGVAIDKQNRIIVAQKKKECNLLAF